MRPAWMDKIVAGLEKAFCKALRDSDIARELLDKYPNEPLEVLARSMADGMDTSECGYIARSISRSTSRLFNYPALCKEAFEKAIMKLLTEMKEK